MKGVDLLVEQKRNVVLYAGLFTHKFRGLLSNAGGQGAVTVGERRERFRLCFVACSMYCVCMCVVSTGQKLGFT